MWRLRTLVVALIVFGCRAPDWSRAAEATATQLPGLIYHPEGDAIVIRNGTRWDSIMNPGQGS